MKIRWGNIALVFIVVAGVFLNDKRKTLSAVPTCFGDDGSRVIWNLKGGDKISIKDKVKVPVFPTTTRGVYRKWAEGDDGVKHLISGHLTQLGNSLYAVDNMNVVGINDHRNTQVEFIAHCPPSAVEHTTVE